MMRFGRLSLALLLICAFALTLPCVPTAASASAGTTIAAARTAAKIIKKMGKKHKKEQGNDDSNVAAPDVDRSGEPMLRVGLATRQAAATISADGAFVIRDSASGTGLGKFGAGTQVSLTARNRQLCVNGKGVSGTKLTLTPAERRGDVRVAFAGRTYRGTLEVALTHGGLTVVNVAPLDDYICGVLHEEMGVGWPSEALKAQAVAARTFALYSKGSHASDGFDVCATTHCQVYGGVGSEDRDGNAAVSATRGEALLYGGKPIYAAFHASSGGRTAGSDENGGNPLPYLKPVRDDMYDNPSQRHWQVNVKASDAAARLKAAGFDVGTLKRVELSAFSLGKKSGGDRYASGRAKTVRFVGSSRTCEVSGNKLRWTFGLSSTLFNAKLSGGKLTFDGWGVGHGVGMSQWGACAMAKAKKSYRDILSHYYSGVALKKMF